MEMENLMEILMSLHPNDIIDIIVDSTRTEALSIPTFLSSGNGCIRITMVPLCPRADEWLGGGSKYDTDGNIIDICEYERVYKVSPEGSHTIDYRCSTGDIEPVNCYGYSALKTAYLSRLRKLGLKRFEDEEAQKHTYFCEENGWSTEAGACVVTISCANPDVGEQQDLLRIYICVSGAKSREDYRCATYGVECLKGFLARRSKYLKCEVFDTGD